MCAHALACVSILGRARVHVLRLVPGVCSWLVHNCCCSWWASDFDSCLNVFEIVGGWGAGARTWAKMSACAVARGGCLVLGGVSYVVELLVATAHEQKTKDRACALNDAMYNDDVLSPPF